MKCELKDLRVRDRFTLPGRNTEMVVTAIDGNYLEFYVPRGHWSGEINMDTDERSFYQSKTGNSLGTTVEATIHPHLEDEKLVSEVDLLKSQVIELKGRLKGKRAELAKLRGELW